MNFFAKDLRLGKFCCHNYDWPICCDTDPSIQQNPKDETSHPDSLEVPKYTTVSSEAQVAGELTLEDEVVLGFSALVKGIKKALDWAFSR